MDRSNVTVWKVIDGIAFKLEVSADRTGLEYAKKRLNDIASIIRCMEKTSIVKNISVLDI